MRTVDLFAGCGGMSLGFQNAGFNLVSAFDNWKDSCEVYRLNFNHPIHETDLSDASSIDMIKEINPQMIIGGPPCQDFSSAGKRDESLGRANLTLTFAKIVAEVQPEWFVMENVARIVKSSFLTEAKKLLKNCDYGLNCEILDASYCGVPQSRKRFFMIGRKKSTDNFLSEILKNRQSPRHLTLHDYFGSSLGIMYYYRHPRSYNRRAVFSIYEPSPTIRGVNRPIPKSYVKHPADPVEIDSKIRPLTTLERSLIQTFPDDFQWTGTKTSLEQMIGNAVPVKLAEFVARCILDYPSNTESYTSLLQGQLFETISH